MKSFKEIIFYCTICVVLFTFFSGTEKSGDVLNEMSVSEG